MLKSFVVTVGVACAELAQADTSCQVKPCTDSRTCVLETTDTRCGAHELVANYRCVSRSELASSTLVSSEGKVPIILRRPPAALAELSEHRRVDVNRRERIVGPCLYDEQCGWHGYCACYRAQGFAPEVGVCSYNESEYAARLQQLRSGADTTRGSKGKELLRFQLRMLVERDNRMAPRRTNAR
jgi:hypothetical protein